MKIAFSLLLLAAPLTADDCASCQLDERGRSALCEPHGSEAGALIKRAKKELKKADSAARIELYEELAEVNEDHENAPSLEAAELLGGALADENLAVRTKVLPHLLQGQHRAAIAAALADAVAATKKEYKALDATMRKIGEDKDLGKKDPTFEDVMVFETYVELLLTTCAIFPDPAVEEALVEFIGRKPETITQTAFGKACESLLRLRTTGGLEAMAKSFAAIEKKSRKQNYEGLGGSYSDRTQVVGLTTLFKVTLLSYRPPGREGLVELNAALHAIATDEGFATGLPPAALHADEVPPNWRASAKNPPAAFRETIEPISPTP